MIQTEQKTDEISFGRIEKFQKKDHLDVDLDAHYERAFNELGLQQTKRDQIITLYLAMFSFLIPFALSMEGISWQVKGLIFLVAAIVGVLFAFVIIRYRIYKEVYWLCCQSLTVLHGIRTEALDKVMIQTVYFRTLEKKGKSFMKKGRDGQQRFSRARYIKKNLFSSESIYFFIHAFITVLIFGMSVALILQGEMLLRVLVGVGCSVVLFLFLAAKYFSECIKVYAVLIDHKESSFNSTFSKAWFLHFYV